MGIIVAGFFGLLILGSMVPQETNADRLARIDKSCTREYSPDPEAVNQCKLRLMVNMLDRDEAARAKRAADGAGQ